MWTVFIAWLGLSTKCLITTAESKLVALPSREADRCSHNLPLLQRLRHRASKAWLAIRQRYLPWTWCGDNQERFTGAVLWSAIVGGVRNCESSRRLCRSEVTIMATSTDWFPSPVTRPAHSPSTVIRPSKGHRIIKRFNDDTDVIHFYQVTFCHLLCVFVSVCTKYQRCAERLWLIDSIRFPKNTITPLQPYCTTTERSTPYLFTGGQLVCGQ